MFFNDQRKRSIVAWCLYDSGCASFSIIVVTFIFSTYYTTRVAENAIVGTYQWANAASIAGLIIAVLSPLLGSIADNDGHHKSWLALFTSLAVVASALLWFAYPTAHLAYYMLGCVIVGSVGYELAQVFYNAFLPSLASKEYLGRISGWGWGCGYFGGILALSIALLIFVRWDVFNLAVSKNSAEIRICGPFAALWYGLFALPFFYYVPSIRKLKSSDYRSAISAGWQSLARTLQKLPQEKNILLYLIAHMIYTDGLNTLFAFGGIFAAGTFGLSFQEVLLFGITMNITAGIGAVVLSWVDDWLGSKETIIISLICLIGLGICLLFLQNKYTFWWVALSLCLFVGPVQAASRSLMVRLIDHKETSAEMFGLYALSGRITAFLGPWLLGMVTYHFNSQRLGMLTVLFFFLIGGILLLPVKLKLLKN